MRTLVRYLEPIGLLLILFSAGWQVFFVNAMTKIEGDRQRYRLEEKVDATWSVLSEMYSHSPLNKTGVVTFAGFAHWNEKYPSVNGLHDPGLRHQTLWFGSIQLCIFAAGSFMVIGAKVRAARESQK